MAQIDLEPYLSGVSHPLNALDLATTNLTSPAVLAFALGFLAALIRSDLRFPEQVTSLLSTYLLLAIGIKGGAQIRDTALSDLALPLVATVLIGIVTPFVAYAGARLWVGLDSVNAASIAAHYGSVSAVTFTAAETFANNSHNIDEGFMAALVAALEVPGILVALLIALRKSSNSSIGHSMREVLTGRSVMLLVGGILIGVISSDSTSTMVEPLFKTLFPGVLVLFLLDLGTLAGQRLVTSRSISFKLVTFAIITPLIFGTLGVAVGTAIDMSVGGAMVLGAMTASASYIAAPAAVRIGLPNADVGLALTAALGITFPFNLIVGIPLYANLASSLG